MKLIPDGYGKYKYIDVNIGDIIPDGYGNYKFYNPKEDNKSNKITTSTNTSYTYKY